MRGGPSTGASSFLHTPPEVFRILRLAQGLHQHRVVVGHACPELGRAGRRSVLPVPSLGNSVLIIHLSLSGL